MIYISGAFVYQPPRSPRPGVSSPPAYLLKLVIHDQDGAQVLNAESDLDRLKAVVVLGYPQGTFLSGGYPLRLTWVEGINIPGGLYTVLNLYGVYDEGFLGFPLPPPGWRPAAIALQLDDTWGAIIPAAVPAVPDEGLAWLVGSGPPSNEQ